MLHDGRRDAEDLKEILCAVRDEYFADGQGDDEIERIAENILHREPCYPARPTYSIGTKIFGSAEGLADYVRENAGSVVVTEQVPAVAASKSRLRLTSFSGMQSRAIDW